MSKDMGGAPRVTAMKVIPVAGQDSMLLNLSGAHGPFFTRNLVILTDNAGHVGVGEVPGGEKIRQTLEDTSELVIVIVPPLVSALTPSGSGITTGWL